MFRRIVITTLFLTAAIPAFSQTITASLEGVIQDPSGAVVSDAHVQIIETTTNVSTHLTTDHAGRFLAPSLPPGPYSVFVDAPGFKRAERSGVVLQVNESARLEIRMEIGAATETVEVSGQAPLLDSTSSTVGQVIDNHSIVNLPLNERNSWSLVFLAPGVTGSVGDKYNNTNISMNGGRPGSMALMVDGIPSATSLTNPIQGFTVYPPVDSVQEFKVETNNYSAEFGRSGSGVVNLIYKSGTNQLHGSAFEFLRNSDLDANSVFSNAIGVSLANFKRNQFGTTVGGPVYLPKLYNGHNKTFFLFGYEGLRSASAATLNTTVPTALQRGGDFSQTRAATGALVTIFDPATTIAAGSGFTRTAFPGNVIPVSRFDPVAAAAVKYYPLPNTAGSAFTGANNFYVAGASVDNIDNYDGKIDENLNDRNRFFVRFSRRIDNAPPANYIPGALGIAQGGVTILDTFINGAADYTYTWSPTLLSDIRVGYGRSAEDRTPRSNNFLPSTLGFPKYMDQAAGQMFPGIQAANYFNLGNGGGSQWGPAGYNTQSIGINNTKVLPSHTLKFGFQWLVMQANISQGADIDGTFMFAKTYTQGPNPNAASNTAGDAMASLLLGVGSGQLQLPRSVAAESKYYAWYFGDDWQVLPKLTLNIGLRYGLDVPLTERFNRMNYFDPSVPSPLAGPTGLPGLMGGLVFAGASGVGRHEATDKNGWDPRFGFAYQATKTTVLRAAFGIFHAPSLLSATGTQGSAGFASTTSFVSAANGVQPANYLSNPFPGGFQPITGNSQGLSTAAGTNISAALLGDIAIPYTENWSFNLQQQLPGGVRVEMGYVGSHGLQLSYTGINLNQLRPEQLSSQLQQSVKNPFYGVITTGTLSTPTIPQSFLAVQYPEYTAAGIAFPTGANSIYHSFQMKTEKRFSSGFNAQASYTFGKLIDDNSINAVVGASAAIQNQYNMRGERSVSANDISQVLSISSVYELPFGKARRFGASWNRGVDAILGGWQMNGIATFGTGLPVALTTQNTSGAGNASERPNNNGQSALLQGPVESRLNRYFNTSVFSQPAPFTFGNTGRTLPDVRIPGQHNLDFSLFKTFRLVERLSLQFRAEAFNFTNSVQFGRPASGLNSNTFGQITTQANSPRQLQFALKLLF
jgi:hypothetical protein